MRAFESSAKGHRGKGDGRVPVVNASWWKRWSLFASLEENRGLRCREGGRKAELWGERGQVMRCLLRSLSSRTAFRAPLRTQALSSGTRVGSGDRFLRLILLNPAYITQFDNESPV